MKIKLLSFILISVVISSCANLHVTKNGYHQTISYKQGGLKRKLKTPKFLSTSTRGKSDKPDFISTETINLKVEREPLKPVKIDRHLPVVESAISEFNNSQPQLIDYGKTFGIDQSRFEVDESIESTVNEPKKVHWASIVGLSTGIVAFFIAGIFFGICAIVFSAIALDAIKKNPDRYTGKGMAIAGLVLGIVALILTLILVAVLLTL